MALLFHRWMSGGVVPSAVRRRGAASGYAAVKNVERGPGVFDWRHYPGPPMRSAWERQCAGPLCLPTRALSSASGGSRWGRCGSRRTGSTTVSVVRCRCVSVKAVITATCIAPGSARRSAAASRNGGHRRGIRGAITVRSGTPSDNAGGESGNGKS
jgi:hypothetical protein